MSDIESVVSLGLHIESVVCLGLYVDSVVCLGLHHPSATPATQPRPPGPQIAALGSCWAGRLLAQGAIGRVRGELGERAEGLCMRKSCRLPCSASSASIFFNASCFITIFLFSSSFAFV